MQSPRFRQILNGLITVGSVLLCLLLLPARLPGMELLGVGPNWLLIWVASWSVRHTALQGAIAGAALGLIRDGMTPSNYPAHAFSLALVGLLTARLQKQRLIQEDFISVALIVFSMAAIAQTIAAIEYSVLNLDNLANIWINYQRIALSSAILSSLWAPVLYFPLSLWWDSVEKRKDSQTQRRY